MNPKSKIEKGKRFEKMVAEEIERANLGFARREVGSGSGRRKGDIFSNLPFLIECKNQKSIQLWKAIDQAKGQAEIGNWDRDKWVLIMRDPRTPEETPGIYAVLDFWQFLELMKKGNGPIIKSLDREMIWRLRRLVDSARDVIKRLE